MSTQNQVVGWTPLLEKIIDNAAQLPLESQEALLLLAKGMAFTRKHLHKEYAQQ